MTMILVFIKEIKQNLRNVRAMAYLVLFPIILILVLGTALSGAFDQSTIKDIDIIYASPNDGPLAQAFKSFITKGGEMGFTFYRSAECARSAGSGYKRKLCLLYQCERQ